MEYKQVGKLTLEREGFSEYKNSHFIQIRDEIIFYVSLQGRKKDIYVWYAIYPLSLPNIWFGNGFGKCAGRIPARENALSIESAKDVQAASSKLNEILTKELFPKLRKIKSLEDIADKYLPWYPSAFTYLAMGNFDKGILLLNEYVEFKRSLYDNAEIEDEVEQFLNTATKENVSGLLDTARENNIKKLRLRKFL